MAPAGFHPPSFEPPAGSAQRDASRRGLGCRHGALAGCAVQLARLAAEALSGMCAIRYEARPLAAPPESRHNGPMSKPRVEFKYKRITEDEWQIEAHYPGAELRHIKGFKSKAEVDDWLQGIRRVDWLRSQGYAK
jgi:hypothetical protein